MESIHNSVFLSSLAQLSLLQSERPVASQQIEFSAACVVYSKRKITLPISAKHCVSESVIEVDDDDDRNG